MRYTVGAWYRFRLLDHSKDATKGDEFMLEICGKVEKVTDDYLHIIYWTCESKLGDEDAEDQNHERASFPLAAIKKKRKLQDW